MDLEYGRIEKQIHIDASVSLPPARQPAVQRFRFLSSKRCRACASPFTGSRRRRPRSARLEDYYNSHGTVWATLLADLPTYVANLARR
jgi:hypothetical protein